MAIHSEAHGLYDHIYHINIASYVKMTHNTISLKQKSNDFIMVLTLALFILCFFPENLEQKYSSRKKSINHNICIFFIN